MKQTYRTKKVANQQASYLHKQGKKARVTTNKRVKRNTYTVHS